MRINAKSKGKGVGDTDASNSGIPVHRHVSVLKGTCMQPAGRPRVLCQPVCADCASVHSSDGYSPVISRCATHAWLGSSLPGQMEAPGVIVPPRRTAFPLGYPADQYWRVCRVPASSRGECM